MERRTEKNRKLKLGFAPTRRNLFSKEDSLKYKNMIEDKIKKWGIDYVGLDWLNDEGLLHNMHDSGLVADRFRSEGVDAVFVPHCNFGTEDAVAMLAKKLGKPLLLWGPRDEAPLPDGMRLRDSQCGLLATSKVLRRMGVPFTYVVNSRVDTPTFERGFKDFLGASAAATTFLGARIGQLDTRPLPFWTVMVNEGELLERWGIQVVPTTLVDLEIGVKDILARKPKELAETVEDMTKRVDMSAIPPESVVTMAAMKIWVLNWAEQERLDAVAIQCWTAIQHSLGISPCFVFAELTDAGLPVGCETDIHGAITAAMLYAASQWSTPPFFADVTIRHPENDNAELFFHCGPFPASLADPDSPRKVSGHYILPDCTPGCAEWRIKGGDMTIARFDGDHGEYSMFMGHVTGTDGPFTRGTYVWAEAGDWPKWEQKLIYGPYIHHVVGIHGSLAAILHEACKYIPGLTPDPVEPTSEEIMAYWRGGDL